VSQSGTLLTDDGDGDGATGGLTMVVGDAAGALVGWTGGAAGALVGWARGDGGCPADPHPSTNTNMTATPDHARMPQ
jgi:hypothetical protein